MPYPKKYMSITELTELGIKRETLNNWAHIRGAPVVRTSNKEKAKILFDTDKLDQWNDKRMNMMF